MITTNDSSKESKNMMSTDDFVIRELLCGQNQLLSFALQIFISCTVIWIYTDADSTDKEVYERLKGKILTGIFR